MSSGRARRGGRQGSRFGDCSYRSYGSETCGRGRGRGRGCQQRAPVSPPPTPIQQAAPRHTEIHIMTEGLRLGGFPGERQNVRLALNGDRFRALYGVSPKAVQAVANNLLQNGFELSLEDLLMAVNWLRLYDTEHVLAGRWGLSEGTVRNRVKKCCKKIQSLKNDKMWEMAIDDEDQHNRRTELEEAGNNDDLADAFAAMAGVAGTDVALVVAQSSARTFPVAKVMALPPALPSHRPFELPLSPTNDPTSLALAALTEQDDGITGQAKKKSRVLKQSLKRRADDTIDDTENSRNRLGKD